MALDKDVYQALEDIVGTENISRDPAVLDSYCHQYLTELMWADQRRWTPRALAVLLPDSAEEVQAIVRTCNRYKIKCKCHSTGWGAFASITAEDCIFLDLVRMNRILEIDDKNMFAVVEPYAINAQLQVELMKRGLNVHMIGAGASCSPLATCTANSGMGPDSVYFGDSSQCLLALEWVMPTGDIIRTGSWGSGAGPFCGEGPGPSVRSIIRGAQGTAGGMGVFTKCAIKLSPWPGPPQMQVEGTAPAYKLTLPENIRAHTVAFPTLQAYAEAYYKIARAEIAYIAHRQFNQWGEELWPAIFRLYVDPTKTLDNLEELLETPDIRNLVDEGKLSFQIILAGNSTRDIEYKEKVLDVILAELGGKKVTAMEQPAEANLTALWMIKLPFKSSNFMMAGGYVDVFELYGTPYETAVEVTEKACDFKRPYMGKCIVDTGDDSIMGGLCSLGGMNINGWEMFGFYDPDDPKSVKGIVDFLHKIISYGDSLGWRSRHRALAPLPVSREKLQEAMLNSKYPTSAFYRWQGRVKKAFDPNNIGDNSYAYLQETEK